MSDFMILLQSRNRVEWLNRFILSVLETADNQNCISFVIRYDLDDFDTHDYVVNSNLKIFGIRKERNLNRNACVNEMVSYVDDDCILGFFADDVIFRTKGWDTFVNEKFAASSPRSVLWGRDGFQDQNIATHFFCKRALYDALGYIVTPIFKVRYSDTWLTETVKRANLAIYCPELFCEHMHPDTGKAKRDVHHTDAEKYFIEDQRIWNENKHLILSDVRKLLDIKTVLNKPLDSDDKKGDPKLMKIAAVAMVKDECDIIELFIRINSRCIDDFYIIDNSSSDSTVTILLKLIAEGFAITIWKYNFIDFQQGFVITNAVRNICKIKQYDFIVPLDADEFLEYDKDSFSRALSVLDENTCGLMHLNNYVPISDDYFSSDTPLFSFFRKRNNEDRFWSKVVIPYNLAADALILEGSHQACDSNRNLFPHKLIDAYISHVPVRSPQQLITKLLIGTTKVAIKSKSKGTEGIWWWRFSQNVRDNNYVITYDMLLDFALSYELDSSSDGFQNDIALGNSTDSIVYKSECFINKDKRYWLFVDQMCEEIRSLRFDNDRSLPTLPDIARRITTGHPTTKTISNYETYESYFSKLRGLNLTILEIGVFEGESTKIFAEYFNNSRIIALDLNLQDINFINHSNITYLQCNQADKGALDKIVQDYCPNGIDIIIEDASHIGYFSQITYSVLFPHLKSGGLYIIEDWGTGYWDDWLDGNRFHPIFLAAFDGQVPNRIPSHDFGMVGFVKSLVDEVGLGDIRPKIGSTVMHQAKLSSLVFQSSICIATKAQ